MIRAVIAVIQGGHGTGSPSLNAKRSRSRMHAVKPVRTIARLIGQAAPRARRELARNTSTRDYMV